MKQLLMIFSVASILTFSCKASKETMNTDTSLYNTKWSLKKIYSGDQSQEIATKAFLRFDKEKGSAGGNGSCNSFGSETTISGTEVHFKNIFSTKMYCEDVQQIENKYFKQLGIANRFEIKDSTMILYHDKQKLLEFGTE